MLKKSKIRKNGHTYLLLGKDKNGIRYYLKSHEYEYGHWFFGGVDYAGGWTHFNYLFSKDPENGSRCNLYDGFKKTLVESPLYDPKNDRDNKKVWQICDLMSSAYSLEEARDVLKSGGSHYTSYKLCKEDIQDETYAKHLEDVIHKIVMTVENMLDPEYVEDTAEK